MLGTFPFCRRPKAIGRSLFATAIRGGRKATGGPKGLAEGFLGERKRKEKKGRANIATAHANQTYQLVHEP